MEKDSQHIQTPHFNIYTIQSLVHSYVCFISLVFVNNQ